MSRQLKTCYTCGAESSMWHTLTSGHQICYDCYKRIQRRPDRPPLFSKDEILRRFVNV